MKKSFKLLAIFALILVFAIVFGGTMLPQSIVGGEVWCNEWISIGCGIKQETGKVVTLSTNAQAGQADSVFVCTYDKGCVIENVSAATFSNCYDWAVRRNGISIPELSGSAYFRDLEPSCIVNRASCRPTAAQVSANLHGATLAKGDSLTFTCTGEYTLAFGWTYTGIGSMSMTYTGKRLRLAYCTSGPTAGSCDAGTSGLEILGADGCKYDVGDRPGATTPLFILNPTGTNIVQGQSYVIGEGSNIWVPNTSHQYVCGTTTDQCNADTDCYYRHPFSWPLGSGLGNADITGTSLNVYGCAATGPEKCLAWSGTIAGMGSCTQTAKTKWCTITQSNVKTCECVPGTSTCGANAFCDSADCMCKPTGTVQCNADVDCGTQIYCDRVTKTLKQPYCVSPGTTSSNCSFKTTANVQCCSATDCGPTAYCTADYVCKQQQQTCEECKWTCCEGDCDPPNNIYFPNVPSGKHCCPDHTNYWVSNISECGDWRCQNDSDCLATQKCDTVTGKCVDNTVCEDKQPGAWPFIVGYKTVTTQTPIYAIPFPWGGGLFQIGVTTETSCAEIWNIALVAAIGGAGIVVAYYFLFFKKKHKGRRRR